jgi:hypothetical protein
VVLLAALVVRQDRDLPVEDPAVAVQTLEREDFRQVETALDDIQMLSEFEFVAVEGEGKL